MSNHSTVRKINSRDLTDLAIIEGRSHLIWDEDLGLEVASKHAWSRAEIERALSGTATSGLVVQEGKYNTVGYAVFTAEKNCFRILRLLIDLDYRRGGFGKDLLSRILDRAAATPRRRRLKALIREDDIDTAYWLAHMGFQSTLVREGWDDDLDGIEFSTLVMECQDV